jgi:UDP-sulfoquinovose synthase
MSETIFIVGGDGFCGWPLALRLSRKKYSVVIIDNLSRRIIDVQMGTRSLVPIATIQDRISCWNKRPDVTATIAFHNVDVSANYERLCQLVKQYDPTTIVHLGEQRSAPYSMKNVDTRMYTTQNNINGTHTLLNVIIETKPGIHLVHLGTMGVYGYGGDGDFLIPEGYLEVQRETQDKKWVPQTIMHPMMPGSVYHATKCMDAVLFQFYAKNYGVRITDLHQGIVWGHQTSETALDACLSNRLDIDGDYGTVLNRFIAQSMAEEPITVYGTGEQTRAFIQLEDSVSCMLHAIQTPPTTGDAVRIINQTTESHQLQSLAELVQSCFPASKISHVENPRKEKTENKLPVCRSTIQHILSPRLLRSEEIYTIHGTMKQFRSRYDQQHVGPSSKW